MTFDLKDYATVAERIAAFYERYPEGSLQSEVVAWPTADFPFVTVRGFAYRNPEDPRPGVGTVNEPYPGKTPYTKDSEIPVAETSSWGRALAALGFETKRSVASADEVLARQSSGGVSKGKAGPPEQQSGVGAGLGSPSLGNLEGHRQAEAASTPPPAPDSPEGVRDPVAEHGPYAGQPYSQIAREHPVFLRGAVEGGRIAHAPEATYWLEIMAGEPA